MFHVKMPNMNLFQLLFLFFFVLFYSNVNIFEFWTKKTSELQITLDFNKLRWTFTTVFSDILYTKQLIMLCYLLFWLDFSVTMSIFNMSVCACIDSSDQKY